MKLRIIRNATVLADAQWPTETCAYIADGELRRSGFAAPFDDEQQSKIEAAVERGEDFVEV